MADINEIAKVAPIFVAIAIVCGIGLIILDDTGKSERTTYTVTNETFNCSLVDGFGSSTIKLNSPVDLIAAKARHLYYFTPAEDQHGQAVVYNQTLQGVAGAHAYNETGNFTINRNTGEITCLSTGLLFAYGNYSISYSYDTISFDRSILDNGIAGLTETSGWLQLIGLVIAAAVVLNLVQRSIGGGQQKVG